jgi:hypothetical protein
MREWYDNFYLIIWGYLMLFNENGIFLYIYQQIYQKISETIRKYHKISEAVGKYQKISETVGKYQKITE